MYKHLLICNIFFIFIWGKIIPPLSSSTKQILPVVSSQLEKNENITHTEIGNGGSKIPSNPVTLPNKDYIALMNLEKEMSGNKEKSVVPRKGVNPQDGIKIHDTLLAINTSSTVQLDNKTDIDVVEQSETTTLNVQKTNDTKPHKPLVVSFEAVAKMDKINNVDIDENSPSTKLHTIRVGGHPEMIVPVVITILVVPIFAIVGYMALKRGQEAWKNRHYKRMDFLLDGMYND